MDIQLSERQNMFIKIHLDGKWIHFSQRATEELIKRLKDAINSKEGGK